MLRNFFPFTPIFIMKFIQRFSMSRECALWISGSKGQDQNSLITENGLCRIISFPLNLSSWNFIQRLPMSQDPMNFWVKRSKVKVTFCSDYWKWFMVYNCSIFTSIILKLHTQTPRELRMCPINARFKRSKVKVTMIMNWLLKMFFWCITAFHLHLHSSNFTHRFAVSPGYTLMIFW